VNVGFDASALEHAAEAACRAGLRAGLLEPDARDLAQDALVRALTTARPPEGVALSAWVYGIAKNLGRDHAKSAQRREVAMDVTPERTDEDDLPTVLAVRRAVDELPPPLRDVITLHELEDNSLRETAEALQIPFDTAKDRLRRAREQLRAQLGDPDLASERVHTRKRAAGYGAAIVAGALATIGKQAAAAAAGTSIAAVASGTATSGSTGGIAAIASGTATAARTVPAWIAGIAGTTLLAGGFVVGRFTAPAREPAPPAPVASAAPSAELVEPPTAVETVPEPAAPTASARAKPVAKPAAAAPTAPGHGNAEHLLVDRARAGLRRGLHDEALVTLMRHAREFPDGDLAEERDVLLIEAYQRLGQTALAKKSVTRYRERHPNGVLRARVDALATDLR
jgi:RNA polymerase sigma-70 factor (ECF subfamily)